MIEITHFTKIGGFLTKRISLNETGAMKSDGSECVMGTGIARRMALPDHHALAEHINNLKPIEAIALGALVPTVTADESKIITKAAMQQMNGHAAAEGSITRTAEFIQYRNGQQAFALIDVDTKGMPPSVRARITQVGGFWSAIVSVMPTLANVARVVRKSTSSCISRSDTGERMPESEGQHIYVLVADGADIERFLRMLHARLWLAGFGWFAVGKSGQLLERSLVDVMVFAAERLVFEGPPRLDPPLQQDMEARRPQAFDGDPADTAAICPDLSAVERSDLDQKQKEARFHLKPAMEKKKAAYITEQAEDIVKRTGMSREAARRTVEKSFNGKLLPAVALAFDDDDLAGCAVADVLKDPDKFVGQTLADPREGVDYGRGKARIMQRADGSLWVHSFAHGRSTYDLCHDEATIEAVIQATAETDKKDVANILERLILQSSLEPDEEQRLLQVACKVGDLKITPLKARIKNARKEQKRRLVAEQAERKAAMRKKESRVELEVPRQGDEWTPVMQSLDEVLCRVTGPTPPMKNIEEVPVEIRCRAPSALHELTSAGSNCDEDEKTRLPAPPQPLITNHNYNSLAHEIEKYIEYYEDSEENGRRVVALPAKFIEHYFDYRDNQLPIVRGIVTAPLVLPDGTLCAPNGLDRALNMYFLIDPELRRLIPNNVSREAVADAMDFLCHAWLCDVAASFQNKCILISAALTILERTLLAQRPAFFCTAGRRGGGKTTALSMLVMAVTGLRPPAAAWSKSEEERRKAYLAYLSEALPVLVWDNMASGEMVSCKYFDALLTSETYTDRILGVSERRIVPSNTVHLFSGNNIGPKGDTASRSFKIELEVNRSDPENRDFVHTDPFQWTLDHRGRILQAMYTILLGNPQLQPGKAQKCKTRFKDWWHLVGSAVEHAAAALVDIQSPNIPESQKACRVDFGEIASAMQAEDENDIALAQVLDIFYRRWPGIRFQGSDVARFLSSGEHAAEDDIKTICAFLDPSGKRGADISPVSIGMTLKGKQNCPVQCENLELTLRWKSTGTRKPAWMWIEAKARAA